jgi:hypothetical protein
MVQITEDDRVSGKLEVFIAEFFNDTQRGESVQPSSPAKLSQKFVNELIGSQLDKFSSVAPGDPSWKSTADRHWHIDWVFSNYVHGKYPETMDMYGGVPGRFHLSGMRGTPKDLENLQMLDALTTTASRSFVGLVQGLKLKQLLSEDEMLKEWYRKLGDA